jgi:hypothetical protein
MAKHLGEPGGENSATQILVVLSDFVTLLLDSLKKHDEREEEVNKRENGSAKKRKQKQATPASVASSGYPTDALCPPLSSLSNCVCSDTEKIHENSNEQIHSMKENITPSISKSKTYPDSKLSTKKRYSIVERGGQKALHITIVSDPQERTHGTSNKQHIV